MASLDRFPQLQISVWDKDTFTHNDSLGSQTLSLVNLLQKHSGYSSAARALKKQVTCDTGSVVLQGPGAGDRGPSIEFSVTWTPGLDGLDSSEDPLMLEPETDGALQLLAEMEMELPPFSQGLWPEVGRQPGILPAASGLQHGRQIVSGRKEVQQLGSAAGEGLQRAVEQAQKPPATSSSKFP